MKILMGSCFNHFAFCRFPAGTASVISPYSSAEEFVTSTSIKPESITPKPSYLLEEPKQLSISSLTAPNMETSSYAPPVVSRSSLATELAAASDSHSTDDFADFQSADPFDTSIVQPAKISLPKLSSFRKVSVVCLICNLYVVILTDNSDNYEA